MKEDDLYDIQDTPEEDDDLMDHSVSEDEKYEHYRFVADKGQNLLRID
ncbi:MAG TPA: RNA pseudouridine synthase, partial [Porphyromonadaceae bacterium]|nr:RNA pseudouridine synthase [Porphyromonadaceae bacterium]